jgi:hypothetical protein
MMNSFALKVVLCLILVAFGYTLMAQENCTAKLDSAKELFNAGQIEEIPALLDSCLRQGFTKDEKIQAYLLLIQAYIFDSDRDKAEKVMNQFLKEFPDYKVQPSDPAEFVELFKAFQIKPTWGIGVTSSANLSQVVVSQHFSTENLNSLNSKYYPDGVGFDAGAHINRYFRKNFWVSLDIQYSMENFKRKDMLGGNNEELNYTEKTGWFSAPIYLNLSIGRRRLSPYIYAGGEFGYLYVDKTYIIRRNLINTSIPNVVQKSTNNLKNREPYNVWALGGAGLQYKALGGYFHFSLGYKYCLMPFVKNGNRYADNNLLYYYQYIDDDFRVNQFYCSLGFTKIFYKIKK